MKTISNIVRWYFKNKFELFYNNLEEENVTKMYHNCVKKIRTIFANIFLIITINKTQHLIFS
jgi:hypothetical protein